MVTMSERMAKMETEIKNISKSLDNHIKEQREDIKALFDRIDGLGNRFAPRITLYIATGAFLTALGIIASLLMIGG